MAVTAQSSSCELKTEVQMSVLESQRQTWKARGHAKERWLERALAEPVTHPRDAEKRALWIRRALDAVKCAKDEIRYEAALLDAYTAHLSALEMILMAAAESKQGVGVGAAADQRV
jgi:hypothetical protein